MTRLAIALILVAGCSTTPIPASERRAVSPPASTPTTPSGKAERRLRSPAFNPFGAVKRPLRRPAHRADRNEQRTPLDPWEQIAACESGGDWQANTGNGFFGGLQMDAAFWRNYGGLRFAARPDLAAREQQVIVAERGLRVQGIGAWPTCGRYL